MSSSARKLVGSWLLVGCMMVFFQVMVGGITRLTESGLSITEWKPIKGIIPPLNEREWQAEFELYQQRAQYKTINGGMQLSEFKWIYFWEYFHRFWARFMGIVFAVGFIYFISKGWLGKDLLLKISPLFIWGGIEGVYGWYIVSRGLKGVFVPPIHLSIHLIIALSLFAYLVWLTLYVYRGKDPVSAKREQKMSPSGGGAGGGGATNYIRGNTNWLGSRLRMFSITILILLFIQIFLGGLLSGMKAGLAYPTWPNMNGQFIPSALFTEKPTLAGFMTYNSQDLWSRALVQLLHRLTAYTLLIIIVIFFLRSRNVTSDKIFKIGLNLFPVFVLLQATIGIVTVLQCVGHVPVFWGVMHQAGAMVLIAETVFIIFHLTNKSLFEEG